MKIIGHIDADCFYVSAERVRDSRLKGRPVAVLGNQGACVIARSYELRPYGVKVGMPVWEAKKLCPEGIYIKRDFKWYGLLSKAMQDILSGYSDTIEYYSVDESFVDFGVMEADKNEIKNLGLKIQERIMKEVGVPVSVGLSNTRILAKTASDKDKPFGVTVVLKENLRDFLKSVPVSDITGIGRKLSKRLEYFRIDTAFDYVNRPAAFIKELLYKPGEEIWYELQGKSILPIRTERPKRKFLSRGGSIWGHYKDRKYVWGFLVRNLERFADALWKEHLETNRLHIILVTSGQYYMKQVEQLSDYTNSFPVLLKALNRGFQKVFLNGVSYSAVHLLGEPLRSTEGKQLNLFVPEDRKYKKIVKVKEVVNSKFGLFTVRSGVTAYCPEVFKDKTSDFEICDIEGKFCF